MQEFDEDAAAIRVHLEGLRPTARALGIKPSTLQGIAARAAARGVVGGPPIPATARPPVGFAVSHNSGQYDADGKLLRQYVKTRRDSGEEFAVPAGHVVKGESALVDPDGRVLAKWIKTREGSGEGLIEGLRAAFAEHEGKAPAIEAPTDTDDDILTVYPLPDLHLGMYGWKPETGADYDLKIASALATQSISQLVAQSRPSKHAVVLGLGDLFHSNDHKEVTPGSGHKLDVDGRWPKVFAEGAKLATRLVDIVAHKHASVEVVFLQGNHDTDASVALTVALSLFYSQNARISVSENANIAWFRRFGFCLLGATHGHTIKAKDFPMIMASDRATDWGETKFRQGFMGHIHHETAMEIGSVRIESFQSPASRDSYNASHGYRAGRSLSAITFHRDRGEIGRHRVNIAG